MLRCVMPKPLFMDKLHYPNLAPFSAELPTKGLGREKKVTTGENDG